jgi:imidazolonepropionase-like amidohydrolase
MPTSFGRPAVLVALAALTASPALAQPSAMSSLTPPANGPRRADSTWFAIADCTVYIAPGAAPQRATVVVRDGRIQAVLPASPGPDGKLGTADDLAARVPVGPAIIDAQGMHLYPAFIDPYVKVETPTPALPASFAHWNNAVTPMRSALAGPGLPEARAAKLRELGFGAAAITPDGGILAGTSAVVSLAKPAGDESAARPPVYAEDTYQRVALETNRGGGYPNSLMGTISLIRQSLSDADWLASLPKSAEQEQRELNEAGMLRLSKHRAGSQSDAPQSQQLFVFDASNELNVLRAAKIVQEFDRSAIIMGSGMEFARLDAIKATGLRFILPLAYPRVPDVSSPEKADEVELRTMMAWEQAPTNPRRLADAGIEFALTTNRLRDASDMPKALREAIRMGLAPRTAFAALTTTPAQMLGVQSQLGTIEAGKRANLVLVTGPLFDLATKDAKIRTLYVDGVSHTISEPALPLDGAWTISFALGDKQVQGTLALEGSKATLAFALPAKQEVLAGPQDGATPKPDKETDKETDKEADKANADKANADKADDDEKSKPTTLTARKVERAGRSVSFALDAAELEKALAMLERAVQKAPATPADNPTDNPARQPAPVALLSLTFDGFDVPQSLTGFAVMPAGTQVGQQVSLQGERSLQGLEGLWPLSQLTSSLPGLENAVLIVSKQGEVSLASPLETKLDVPLEIGWQEGELTLALPAGAGTLTLQPRWQDDALSASVQFEGPAGVSRAIVSRRPSNPFAGEWRVTTMDGKTLDPNAAEQVRVAIEASLKKDGVKVSRDVPADAQDGQEAQPEAQPEGHAKRKIETKAVKSADAKRKNGLLTFSHTLKDIGIDSPLRSSDTLRMRFASNATSDLALSSDKRRDEARRLDRIEGESVLTTPDAQGDDAPIIHRYVLERIPDEPDPTVLKPKDIPEKLALPFGPFALAKPVDARPTLLVNATLWTNTAKGDEDDIVPVGTLALANGKILSLTPHEPGLRFADALAQAKAATGFADDALVIDCTAMHVTPGLIDAHSHTGISQGVNEGGQAVTAEVRIQDVTNPDDVNWYRQLAGGITSVLSLHGSANAIGGQSQVNKLRWGCTHPDDMHFAEALAGIKFALGENPRQVNWDANTDRYPKTRMGVEMLIRDRFTAAKDYAARRKQDPKGTRRDLEVDAIVEILEGSRLVHCHSYRQDEIVMLTHVARDFGFRIGTFQHILEGYKVADYVRDYSGGGSGFTDWWAFKQEVQDAIPAGLPLMQKVGATTSFNSDSNNLARFMNVEAAKAVRYGREVGGFTEAQALRFVTSHPAMQLKVDDRVGRLRPGMDADVVVWTRSPLSTLSLVHSTFVDGKLLFSREEDAKLQATNAAERSRLIAKILEDPDAKKAREKELAKADAKPAESESSFLEELGLSQEQAQHLRQLYLDAMTSGRAPTDAPGLCGCGLPHPAWSTMR